MKHVNILIAIGICKSHIKKLLEFRTSTTSLATKTDCLQYTILIIISLLLANCQKKTAKWYDDKGREISAELVKVDKKDNGKIVGIFKDKLTGRVYARSQEKLSEESQKNLMTELGKKLGKTIENNANVANIAKDTNTKLVNANYKKYRIWTDKKGRMMLAKLISIEKVEDKLVCNFKKKNSSKNWSFSADKLDEKNKLIVEKIYAQNKDILNRTVSQKVQLAKLNSQPTKFTKLFKSKLVLPKGNGFKKAKFASEPEYFAFYYSASWCGPCRSFTPKLVRFYKQNEDLVESNLLNVVLVSSDYKKANFLKYMKQFKMPWPAVKFEDKDDKLLSQYSANYIPSLIVLNKNGKVFADSRRTGIYDVLNKLGKLSDELKSSLSNNNLTQASLK